MIELIWFFGIGYAFVGLFAANGAAESLRYVGVKRALVFGFVCVFWGVLYLDTLLRATKK